MREEYLKVEGYNSTGLIEVGVGELEPILYLYIFVPLLSFSVVALEIIQWNILVSKKYRFQMASILNFSSSGDSSKVVVKEVLPIQPWLTFPTCLHLSD